MTAELKLNPRVRIAPTEYGAAVLGPSGSYFRLNRTAAIVITAMLGGQDADGVVERLEQEFTDTAPPRTQLSADVAAIVQSLVNNRILVRA